MKDRKAVTWYEYWAEKYNTTLKATYLQTSHWGSKTLAQFLGYFGAYEDKPDFTKRIEANRLLAEWLHKNAVARLKKIEGKIAEWENKF